MEEEVDSGFGPALSQQGWGSAPDAPGLQRRHSHPTRHRPHPAGRAGGRARLSVPVSRSESRAGPGGTDRRAASRAPSGLSPGSTGAGRAAVGARDPWLPSALSLGARPPASPPPAPPPAPPSAGRVAEPPACKVSGARAAASRRRRRCRVPRSPRARSAAGPRTSRSLLRRPSVLGGAAHGPAREPTSGAGAAGPRRGSGECGAGAARLGSGKTGDVRGGPTWRPGLQGTRRAQGESGPERARWVWGNEGEARGSHRPHLLPWPPSPASPDRLPGTCLLTPRGLGGFSAGGVGGSLLPAASAQHGAGQRAAGPGEHAGWEPGRGHGQQEVIRARGRPGCAAQGATGVCAERTGHLPRGGDAGAEAGATGRAVSSSVPGCRLRPVLIFPVTFHLFFSRCCFCFYFEHPGWRQRWRGRGGGARPALGARSPAAQHEGRPPGARRLQVRSLSPEADCARLPPRFLTPGPPGAGAPARRALDGDQEQGCGARGAGPAAWGALGSAAVPGAVGLTPHGLRPAAVRDAPHTGPVSPGGLQPPPQHPTLQDQPYPCLARVSLLPQPSPLAIFIHYLHRDAVGGILERRVQIRRLRPALAEAVPCQQAAAAGTSLSEPQRGEPRF